MRIGKFPLLSSHKFGLWISSLSKLALASAAACTVSSPSQAASLPLDWLVVDCRPGNAAGTHYADAEVRVDITDLSPFKDDDFVAQTLEHVRGRVFAKCESDPKVIGIYFRAFLPNWAALKATYRLKDAKWVLENNGIAERLRSEETDKRLADAKAIEAQRRREELDAFVNETKLTAWVSSDQLVANPFALRGKVVGVATRFDEMISEDEAVFDGVVVKGVPADLFTHRGQDAILAVRVTGRSPVLTSRGEVSLATAEAVTTLNCANSNCSAFRP